MSEEVSNETIPEIPIIKVRRGKAQPKVHLFSIEKENGDVVKFEGPASVSWNTSLKALDILSKYGEDAMQAFGIKTLLGQEGFDRLMAMDDLEPEEFAQVMDHVAKVVIGDAGGGKGKASPKRRSNARG